MSLSLQPVVERQLLREFQQQLKDLQDTSLEDRKEACPVVWSAKGTVACQYRRERALAICCLQILRAPDPNLPLLVPRDPCQQGSDNDPWAGAGSGRPG